MAVIIMPSTTPIKELSGAFYGLSGYGVFANGDGSPIITLSPTDKVVVTEGDPVLLRSDGIDYDTILWTYFDGADWVDIGGTNGFKDYQLPVTTGLMGIQMRAEYTNAVGTTVSGVAEITAQVEPREYYNLGGNTDLGRIDIPNLPFSTGDKITFKFLAKTVVTTEVTRLLGSSSGSSQLHHTDIYTVTRGTMKLDGVDVPTGTTVPIDGLEHTIEFTSSVDGDSIRYIGGNPTHGGSADYPIYDILAETANDWRYYPIADGWDNNPTLVETLIGANATLVNGLESNWNNPVECDDGYVVNGCFDTDPELDWDLPDGATWENGRVHFSGDGYISVDQFINGIAGKDVVFTVDVEMVSGELRIYYDGSQIGGTTITETVTIEFTPAIDAEIGFEVSSAGGEYYIDNVSIKEVATDNYEDDYTITGVTYYADPTATGAGDGLTPENAFATLSAIGSQPYLAGDALLIKAGEVWDDTLDANMVGADGNHCLIGAYGVKTLAMPLISNPIVHSGMVWTDRSSDLGANTWSTSTDHKVSRLWENDVELSRAYDEDYTQDFGTTYRFHTNLDTDELYLYSTTDPTPNAYFEDADYYAFELGNHSYVDVHDIETRYGETRMKDTHHINVYNCILGRKSAQGLIIEGDSEAENTSNIYFNNTVVEALWEGGDLSMAYQGHESDTRGCEDGLHMSGFASDIEFDRCTLSGWGHSIINMLCEAPDLMENIYIHHCTINGVANVSYGKGIDIIGQTNNIRIHYNHILNVPVQNQYGCQNVDFQFNIVENQRSCSVRASDNANNGHGLHLSAKDVPYEVRDFVIGNNIFINCEGSAVSMYAQSGNAGDDIRNIVVKNNIMTGCGTAPDWNGAPVETVPTVYQETAEGSSIIENIQYRNNLVGVGGDGASIIYHNVVYSDMAAFEAAVLADGVDTAINNVDGDPTFISDFILDLASAGVGIAEIPDLVEDYAGELIAQGVVGSGYDVGIYNQGTTI
ncbi:MAG: hypothetical protein DRH37_09060 [Deltaproteobacteria bacterium]|nr:MAG: hypothetical protein DRH37_09060 [Deltaproteobacteria bacterium]